MPKQGDRLRILPCTDFIVHADRLEALEEAPEMQLLSLALAPMLRLRVERDHPDVIVIVTERFLGPAWSDESQLRSGVLSAPTMLLTAEADTASRRRAERISISTVMPWDVTSAQLIAAVTAVDVGLKVSLAADDARPGDFEEVGDLDALMSAELPDHLTRREVEVLRLMALGLANKQIAGRLKISEHTAKFHVGQVLAKLGASSRTEAVSLGITHGLVAI